MSVLYAALFVMFFSGLVCSSAFADDYSLSMGVMPSNQDIDVQDSPDYFSDIDDFDEWQDIPDDEWDEYVAEVDASFYGVASSASASPSQLSRVTSVSDGPALYSTYNGVYEGSISSSILDYFRGIVERLGPDMHYVLFRQDRYNYRLVISPDLVYQGGVFTAPASGCQYVLYYSYDSTVSSGDEGSFRLSVNNYTLFTDLVSPYPVLSEGVRGYEFKTVLFMLGVIFVFMLCDGIYKLCVYRFRN